VKTTPFFYFFMYVSSIGFLNFEDLKLETNYA